MWQRFKDAETVTFYVFEADGSMARWKGEGSEQPLETEPVTVPAAGLLGSMA